MSAKNWRQRTLGPVVVSGARETPQGKLISVNAAELHGRMGLSVDDVQRALDKIGKARIISVVPEGVIVPDVGKMQKYLEFLEMKERFGDT